jgi:hypothetical protein
MRDKTMKKYNPENERIKRSWFTFLKEAFLSYGEVACQRQGEIIRDLAKPQSSTRPEADDIAEAVFRRLQKAGLEAERQ